MGKRTFIKRRTGRKKNASLIRALVIAAGLLLWETASADVQLSFYTSYPTAIFQDLIVFFREGEALRHISITLQEAWTGLLFGSIAGVGLGVLFSQFSHLGKILVPVVAALQGIPQLILAPLYILWFGIGLKSKVFLAGLSVFFNVFATYNAIKNIDPKLIESAVLLGAGKLQVLFHVVIPYSMPWIISGVRIGSSVCIGAIIGEYMGSSGGLGWMVNYSSSFFRISRVMSCVLLLLLIGMLAGMLFDLVERGLLRWRPEMDLSVKNG